MMGVEGGWTGAQGAYDYLWPFIGNGNPSDLAQRAGWAVDFYPGTSTPPPPPPPPPPPALAIANVTAGNVTATSATITWTTNVQASSRVDYGTTTAYRIGRHQSGAGHEPQRLAGRPHRGNDVSLSRHGQSGAGETAATGDFTLTTAAAADTTPPVTAVTPSAGATGVPTTDGEGDVQ